MIYYCFVVKDLFTLLKVFSLCLSSIEKNESRLKCYDVIKFWHFICQTDD